MMPRVDGYETCRQLRKHPELKYSKIILISAKAMLVERLKGYEAGADDYVTKPFDHAELSAKVKVFLRLKFMQEMDRQKTEFLTILTHTMRTALTKIVGPAELLAGRGEVPVDKRTEFARMILQATTKLESTLEQALLIFSFKAGDIEFHLDDGVTDLRRVADETIERRGEEAKRRNIQVELICPDEQVVGYGAMYIHQVLGILLDKMMQLCSSSARIRVIIGGNDGGGVCGVEVGNGTLYRWSCGETRCRLIESHARRILAG
jgi:CheY-like chemotaxis protein